MYIQGSVYEYEDLVKDLKHELKKHDESELMLDALKDDLSDDDLEPGASIIIDSSGCILCLDETDDIEGTIREQYEYQEDDDMILIQVNSDGDIWYSYGKVSDILDSFV